MRAALTYILVTLLVALQAAPVAAYPLYDSEDRQMPRLEYYKKRPQPHGARLQLQYVDLRLTDRPAMDIPAEQDPDLARDILSIIPAHERERYSWAVYDLTDLENPAYVEHRGDAPANPGSVGKILILLAMFQALADAYPDDIDARMRVLTDTVVTADEFIITNSHDVPKVTNGRLHWEPLKIGESGNLWTFLDWMASASSNAAASICLREAMLLQRYGKAYPLPPEEAAKAIRAPSAKERQAWLMDTLRAPISRNGMDTGKLRQGGFFTRRGKQLVPGTNSTCTSRELIRFLLKMEQGTLVDEWSSREIKRLLYVTQKRIRYASSPALKTAAVYFKSGSLYSCRPEPGFSCGKYKGNRINMLNSVAVVEDPAEKAALGKPDTYYLCVMLSNVLKKNSAVQHQSFGTFLHRIIQKRHGVKK